MQCYVFAIVRFILGQKHHTGKVIKPAVIGPIFPMCSSVWASNQWRAGAVNFDSHCTHRKCPWEHCVLYKMVKAGKLFQAVQSAV